MAAIHFPRKKKKEKGIRITPANVPNIHLSCLVEFLRGRMGKRKGKKGEAAEIVEREKCFFMIQVCKKKKRLRQPRSDLRLLLG